MNDNYALEHAVLRAARLVAVGKLADFTQPPNVRDTWTRSEAYLHDCEEIILANLQESGRHLERVHQPTVCTEQRDMLPHRSVDPRTPLPK